MNRKPIMGNLIPIKPKRLLICVLMSLLSTAMRAQVPVELTSITSSTTALASPGPIQGRVSPTPFRSASRLRTAPGETGAHIPWDQIGAKAGAQYRGDGLSIVRSEGGALLRCVFQKLEGLATAEGLWLTSTLPDAPNHRFRVVPCGLRREGREQDTLEDQFQSWSLDFERWMCALPTNLEVEPNLIRLNRPGLVEEYSVSMEGVRQDFVVTQRPTGAGELRLELEVAGAQAEPSAHGARLVLDHSGRKIAYSRLRVEDAEGRHLNARIEAASVRHMSVLVDDAAAVYPVRIDPTFSDDNWISLNPSIPGADGHVLAAATDLSGNLYIGGDFKVVGDVIANGIARWNGSSWSALGSGLNDTVSALAVSGSDLYAGGYFTTAGGGAATNIAKWNGSSWVALGSEINGPVLALAVSGSDLYAGGNFATAGGGGANYIAKWNGTTWSALGSGMGGTYPWVYALAVSGGNLYAGGSFTTAGGVPANHIAKWNGSDWSALGMGISNEWGEGYVAALAVSGSDLYAGGFFTAAGGSNANCIAKWNGSSWSALGSGVNDDVQALAFSGSDLYAGGYFTTAGGGAVNYIAKWNGSPWSALGSGMNGLPDGLPPVHVVAVSGGDLYVGGSFTMAGGSAANNIAKWNGSSWSALGSGMDGPVYALAMDGSDLYAGGSFTTAGGSNANCIAKWNGSTWSALGSGINSGLYGGVYALAVSGSDLYAGGTFTMAGGIAANRIAKWNGSTWSALGSGINDWIFYSPDWPPVVRALVVSGSEVYVGGSFDAAGGNAATNIAKWNGSNWSALGSGLGLYYWVYALAISGSNLYAGGSFTTAGGSNVNCIAKWNGSSWSALGSGMGGSYPSVSALAVSGSDLYAAGEFTTAGGSAANHIAKWNGSNWSALGSGMGGTHPSVSALAVSGSDLYAAGGFTTSGGKVSAYVARAVVYPPVLSLKPDGSGAYLIRFSGIPGTGYRLQRAPALAGPWDSSSPQTAPASGLVVFRDTSPAPGQTFYRAVQP